MNQAPKEIHLQLARNLRHLMEQNHLTFRQLGQLARVSPSTISDWSNGAKPLNILAVKRVADYFEVSLDDLLFAELSAHAVESN